MLNVVTGANGHIGAGIVRQLVQRGERVRAFVRRGARLDGLKDANGDLLPGVELAYGDILDKASVRLALTQARIVFHAAAVFKTRLADETELLRTNIAGTRNVLEACADVGSAERIVYTSSVAAVGYSRAPDRILTEDDWANDPIDAYTRSKLEAEKLVVELTRTLKLPVVTVNPGTVLGAHDHSPTPSNGFILMAMRKPPPVYFSGGHSYAGVDQVAAAHLAAAARGHIGARYILAGENVSIEDLFLKLSRLTGGRRPWLKAGKAFVAVTGLGFECLAALTGKPPLYTRQKAGRLIDYYGYFDSSRAVRDLGYVVRPLDDLLQECRDWFRRKAWL